MLRWRQRSRWRKMVCDFELFLEHGFFSDFLNSAIFSLQAHIFHLTGFRNFSLSFPTPHSGVKAYRSRPPLFSVWVKRRCANSTTCCLIVWKQTRLSSAWAAPRNHGTSKTTKCTSRASAPFTFTSGAAGGWWSCKPCKKKWWGQVFLS